MRTNVRKKAILFLSLVAMLFLFVCAVANFTIGKADSVDIVEFEIEKTAEIRAATNDEDDSGIRFTAVIEKNWYDTLVEDNTGKPVYFGIEVSVNGANRKYYSNVVSQRENSNNDQINSFSLVNFKGEEYYKYFTSIIYNRDLLKEDLIRVGYATVENIDEVIDDYLRQAYSLNLTARAYYKIEGDDNIYYGPKGDANTTTRSMWGIGSYAYTADEDTRELLAKYFVDFGCVEEDVYIQEDGEIVGYGDIKEESFVYIDTQKTEIVSNGGKYYVNDLDLLSSYEVSSSNVDKFISISIVDGATSALTSINAKYVTGAIDEKEDFAKFFNLDEEYTIAGTSDKLGEVVDGYFVMTTDIDAEGTNLGLTHSKMKASTTIVDKGNFYGGFVGTFDGQDHIISNYVPSSGGLFGMLTGAPTVKNVAFENLKETATGNALGYYAIYRATYNSGANTTLATNISDDTLYGGRTINERNAIINAFGLYVRADINNVFVRLSDDSSAVDGIFYVNSQYFNSGNFTNVIVDASKATVPATYSFAGANGTTSNSTFDNFYVITDKDRIMTGLDSIPSGAQLFANYNAFKSANSSSFTASCWEIENGVIFFKGLKDTIKADGLYVKEEGKSRATSFEFYSADATVEIYDFADAKITTLDSFACTLNGIDSSNLAFEDGKIVVKDFVDGEYAVSFTVGNVTKEIVISLTKTTYNIASEAIYDATENVIYYRDALNNKIVVSGGTMQYVVSDSEKYDLTNNSISYMHLDFAGYDFNGNGYYGNINALKPKLYNDGAVVDISIPYSIRDEVYTGVKFDVIQDSAVYHFTNVIIATQVIDDGAELKQIFNTPDQITADGSRVYTGGTNYRTQKYGTITKGVYMLADNIDASAEGSEFVFDNSYFNFFEGILDGRGYTISNLNLSGTVDNPGNGLFSAISEASFIQNIAFTNVSAEYGSVFMGNLVQDNYIYPNTIPIYDGAQVYRDQLFGKGSTIEVSTVLKSRSRIGARGLNGWLNVYVQVAPSTSHLMGVISRNLPNRFNAVKAHNLIIEYLPTDTSAYADMTNSTFGVLFGGAYSLSDSAAGDYAYWTFDVPDNYCSNGSLHGVRTYYNMTGSVSADWTNHGVLDFADITPSYYALAYEASKIFVISPVGLVSSNKGAVKGTNETAGDNEYKFISMTTYSGEQKLERFDSYDDLASMSYTVDDYCGLYLGNGLLAPTGFNKHWSVNGGKIAWISK